MATGMMNEIRGARFEAENSVIVVTFEDCESVNRKSVSHQREEFYKSGTLKVEMKVYSKRYALPFAKNSLEQKTMATG